MLEGERLTYVILEGYGLDVSVFLTKGERPWFRQLELKAFVGGRAGGVGFGNQQGRGPQVDLLWDAQRNQPRIPAELTTLDSSIRWILANGLKETGTPRYALFTCAEAQQAAMGGVRPGKQNNLRVSALQERWLSWPELIVQMQGFLLGETVASQDM